MRLFTLFCIPIQRLILLLLRSLRTCTHTLSHITHNSQPIRITATVVECNSHSKPNNSVSSHSSLVTVAFYSKRIALNVCLHHSIYVVSVCSCFLNLISIYLERSAATSYATSNLKKKKKTSLKWVWIAVQNHKQIDWSIDFMQTIGIEEEKKQIFLLCFECWKVCEVMRCH